MFFFIIIFCTKQSILCIKLQFLFRYLLSGWAKKKKNKIHTLFYSSIHYCFISFVIVAGVLKQYVFLFLLLISFTSFLPHVFYFTIVARTSNQFEKYRTNENELKFHAAYKEFVLFCCCCHLFFLILFLVFPSLSLF